MQGRLNCGVGLAGTIGSELSTREIKKVLVVTEAILVKLGVLDVVFDSLKEAGVDYVVFDGNRGRPFRPSDGSDRQRWVSRKKWTACSA